MPYGFILFIVVRFFIYLLGEDKKNPEESYLNGIEYVVNGKKIQMSHLRRCIKLLGIPEDKVLTEEVIRHAYFNVYNEVAELREKVHVIIDVAELRASKSYLLDRWAYLAHKN